MGSQGCDDILLDGCHQAFRPHQLQQTQLLHRAHCLGALYDDELLVNDHAAEGGGDQRGWELGGMAMMDKWEEAGGVGS